MLLSCFVPGTSKRKVNHEEFEKSETKKNHEKNRQYEEVKSSTSKRSRQETLLDSVNDDYSPGLKPDGHDGGSKNGHPKERGVLLEEKKSDELPHAPKCEMKKLGSGGSERAEVSKSPESCESEDLKTKGKRADGEESKLAMYSEMDAINRSNEERPQSMFVTQSNMCAKGDSIGKADTVKKKLPKCEYGKSCYR